MTLAVKLTLKLHCHDGAIIMMVAASQKTSPLR
jgi:hypothetical protein